MNEPKRRGRPPKTAQEQIGAMQAEVINAWADSAAQEARNRGDELMAAAAVVAMPAFKAQIEADVFAMAAQAYAERVWSGQSNTIPRNERIKRVAAALEGQGMSMEGVVLP